MTGAPVFNANLVCFCNYILEVRETIPQNSR